METPVKLTRRIDSLKALTGASTDTGWMCDEVAFLIYAMVKFFRPDVVIQTGHLWGKSACVILEALTDEVLNKNSLESPTAMGDAKFAKFVDANRPKKCSGKLLSIDPRSPSDGTTYLHEIYGNAFEYFPMTSAEFFQNILPFNGERLMGIVDGDHSVEGAEIDIRGMHKLGAEIIIVDDTEWLPELREISYTLASELGYQFMNFTPYNGIAVLTKHQQ